MPAQVRQADLDDPGDAQAIVELTDAYASDPMGGGQGLEARTKEQLVPAMREHGHVRVLLAEEGGAAIGLCTTVLSFSAFNAAPVLNIHDLAVLAEHRGQGVGRCLLEAAEALARELGCCRLTLEVLEKNPAKHLYQRAGYEKKSNFMVRSLGDDRIA